MIDIASVPILNNQTTHSIIMQANGDESIVYEIFESFVYDVQNMINQINLAVKNSDFKQFKLMSHTIKGLSATIGATQLHIVSKEIDLLLKEDKKEEAIGYIPLLTEVYNNCKVIVKKEFKIA